MIHTFGRQTNRWLKKKTELAWSSIKSNKSHINTKKTQRQRPEETLPELELKEEVKTASAGGSAVAAIFNWVVLSQHVMKQVSIENIFLSTLTGFEVTAQNMFTKFIRKHPLHEFYSSSQSITVFTSTLETL